MRPFANTPYFIANPLQANALVRLRHAVTFPGGVALVSGGPGVGKSAFARQALSAVESEVQVLPFDLRSAEPGEFVEAILGGLGAASPAASGDASLPRLRDALLGQQSGGRQLVLFLDISGLNVDLARRLLRFMHLCGEQQTPVSLLLMGPHTLHQLLDVPGLIQLRQRLSFRHKIRPLTLLETGGYLRHCLTESGANPDELMTPNAAASVYLYVAGVPRLINTLMDAALGEVRVRPGSRIDADLVRQVAEQLGWKPLVTRAPTDPASKPAAAAPTARRPAERASGPLVAEPAPVPADPLPASDITRRLQMNRKPVTPPPAGPEAAAPPAPAAEPRWPPKETPSAPPVPMDDADPGATGMLRLEDLDERFAETLFSEDSGHFKVLIDSGKSD